MLTLNSQTDVFANKCFLVMNMGALVAGDAKRTHRSVLVLHVANICVNGAGINGSWQIYSDVGIVSLRPAKSMAPSSPKQLFLFSVY